MTITNPQILISNRLYALSCYGIPMSEQFIYHQFDTFLKLKIAKNRSSLNLKANSQTIYLITILIILSFTPYEILLNPHSSRVTGSAQLNCIRKLYNIIHS